MSVQYKAMAKGQPGVVGGGDHKFYASIVRGKKIDLRTMLGEISELNVAHSGAILAVLECFLSRVDYHITNGRAVELGQLGSFYPAISSTPSDTEVEVRGENIKKFRVNFRPSMLLRERLDHVKFEKVTDEISTAKAPTEQ